jgi:hypothetical protein
LHRQRAAGDVDHFGVQLMLFKNTGVLDDAEEHGFGARGRIGADAQSRQLCRSDTRFDKKEHGGEECPSIAHRWRKTFHCKSDSRCRYDARARTIARTCQREITADQFAGKG